MTFVRCAAAVAALCMWFDAAKAQPAINVAELLAAQNQYRANVGVPPLRWSEALAKSAQKWADELAQTNQLKHSGWPGVGENLAMWTAGKASLTALVELWGEEKRYFVRDSFPWVSKTGNWKTVGHYSQLIWRQTTEVGCGLATGAGNDFLVCQYNPQGNVMGELVY